MAKKKQEVKLKEPVRIRFKQLANGNQSIYLDYYTGDVIRKENYVGGKRQYEFLKLYLIPEKTREDKAKNEATLALAKAIQSKYRYYDGHRRIYQYAGRGFETESSGSC